MKEKLQKLSGALVIAMLLFLILTVMALFSGAVMGILGLEYGSLWDFILFFCIGAVAAFPINTLAGAIPKALLRLGKLHLKAAKALYILLDAASTAVVMAAVDSLMERVSVSDAAILAISLIFSIPGVKDVKIGNRSE